MHAKSGFHTFVLTMPLDQYNSLVPWVIVPPTTKLCEFLSCVIEQKKFGIKKMTYGFALQYLIIVKHMIKIQTFQVYFGLLQI